MNCNRRNNVRKSMWRLPCDYYYYHYYSLSLHRAAQPQHRDAARLLLYLQPVVLCRLQELLVAVATAASPYATIHHNRCKYDYVATTVQLPSCVVAPSYSAAAPISSLAQPFSRYTPVAIQRVLEQRGSKYSRGAWELLWSCS